MQVSQPMVDPSQSSPLLPPTINKVDDLEAQQIQCRICLETDGRNFIAPCKCKGSSKYVHRDCLDHWRAVKEGFAFAHCTTCKSPYHLRVNVAATRKWQTLKFRFFVTRDILSIFLAVQLVISLFAYMVYSIDKSLEFWLRVTCGFDSVVTFYYLCGALLFFAVMGMFGCFITCHDPTVQDDLEQPCREVCHCCCEPRISPDYHTHSNISLPVDCTVCCSDCTECCSDCFGRGHGGGGGRAGSGSGSGSGRGGGARGDGGETVLTVLLITILIVVIVFAVIGIFYSILVATMVGQRIWQRHYHILEKRMLTQEYIVEDVERYGSDWSPPPLPPEHVQQLKTLGLLQ